MINNSDWEVDYLYYEILEVLTIPDSFFIDFLVQLTHPEVRKPDETALFLEIINKHLEGDGYKMQEVGRISGYPVYGAVNVRCGPSGSIKNLIFAADGYKPRIVITDSLENNIEIVDNGEHCLVYEENIPQTTGLKWKDLVNWWARIERFDGYPEAEEGLFQRLRKTLASPPEQLLFDTYFNFFKRADGDFPALIPQVYLHYNPYARGELQGELRITRQRMDFLILLLMQY
ncbi:hypothetical protein FHS15_001988 [Paenibacillus castaneae]|nr:hypothetical protein [Paenibacillus castaneae]